MAPPLVAIPIITAVGRFAAPYLSKELSKLGLNKFVSTYGKDAFTSLNETLAADTPMLKADSVPMVNENYKAEATAFAGDLTVPGVIAPDATEIDKESQKIREMTKPVGFPADPPIKPDIKTGDTTPPEIDTTEEFPSEEEKLPNIEGFPSDTKQLPVIFEQKDIKKQTEQALEPKVEFGPLTETEKQTAQALMGDQPEFYSRAVDAIKNAKQNKFTKGKWKSIVQSNSTKDEMKYLGLDKYLQGNESISKQDLLDFVQEKNLAPYINVTTGTYEDIAPTGMAGIYKNYTLGFGKDEEFTSFQIDKSFFNNEDMFQSQHGNTEYGSNMFGHARTQVGVGEPDSPPADFGSKGKEITGKLKNTLVIDEIQSDWLQRLNKYGPISQYNIEDRGDSFVVLKDGKVVERITSFDREPSIEVVEDMLLNRGDDEKGIKAAPDFPIVESKKWVELILNEMIKKAVYDGRDSIAITNGQIQFDRYDGMDREDAEGLKKFYDDIVAPQLEKIAKNYNVKTEKISIENPEENVYDQDLMGINTRMKEAMDAGYTLKKIEGGLLQNTMSDEPDQVPDFFSIYSNSGKAQGSTNIFNVIDQDNTGRIEDEARNNEYFRHPKDYYVWVLKDSKLEKAIDDHNSGKEDYINLSHVFFRTEDRPTAFGTTKRTSVKFDMPISVVDEDIEPEATIPGGTGPDDLVDAETVRVSTGDIPDNTNYSAFLMNQYIKNRKDSEKYDLKYEEDQQTIIKMRLPKKLQKDILSKPIKLSKAKAQTDRLFA
jgi:hypothetical protein